MPVLLLAYVLAFSAQAGAVLDARAVTPPLPGAAAGGARLPAVSTNLAGRSIASYPYFEYTRAFNAGEPVELAFDPRQNAKLAGRTVALYLLEHRSLAEWLVDPKLAHLSGKPLQLTFSTSGLRGNTFSINKGTLDATAGIGIGHPYDLVLDVNSNGVLDEEDLIDGLDGEAGFYVVDDLVQRGPLAVTEVLYAGGSRLRQDAYYPRDIATLGRLPLIVVSHGNGHNYQWYDHIGFHMASYGYVVMSHFNDTGPGIEAASQTTLDNTHFLLANQATIAGGVLDGHIDSTRITWVGHSRGGEGVVRAYDRLFDGDATFSTYGFRDIVLISSIAPTVFLARPRSSPHRANFSLWTGGADSDVNGCVSCAICQTFRLHDRANGTRLSISLHGVGHGAFHDGGGSTVAQGPCQLTRAATHDIMRGYLLPLVKFFVEGQPAAEDYLWRQWEAFHPLGAPRNSCVVVDLMYRESSAQGTFVLDDYQAQADPLRSSSGAEVAFSVANLSEGLLDDGNLSFTHVTNDVMNGMANTVGNDRGRGVVFEWGASGDAYYTLEVPPGARDLTRYEFLSFRAAQATRHPLTTEELSDLTFSVRLVDAKLAESTIGIGAFGGGIEEPYQRAGCGSGLGWANEFETIRLRLTDFQNAGTGLDLSNVVAVDFLFGASHGSAGGRIGLDDVELVSRGVGRRTP